MDGSQKELEYETFNAASAEIIINGKIVHPCFCENKMVNSMYYAQKFINGLVKKKLQNSLKVMKVFTTCTQ